MRFSAAAALPLLALAHEDPFAPYKAQLQSVLGKAMSYLPNPGTHDAVAALEAKMGSMRMSTLTLENWRDTLYEHVAPDATAPDEWWVLLTGRNRTCFGEFLHGLRLAPSQRGPALAAAWLTCMAMQGHCAKVEQAFNETAAKFAIAPGSPRMAYLNCDDQPILCNSWSASTGHVWSINMLPAPRHIDIYKKRLNLTTTTSDDLVEAAQGKDGHGWTLLDSWFHPFDGKATELGLAVPWGYIIWAFNLVPNWLLMIVVSFASRSMM